MYLEKLTTINWGTLPSQTFEFTHATLITGESGAGKSMLLDAIQTIYTASHGALVKYNVAQSENADRRSRAKAYRTLPGYALGQLGNAFQRTSSHTWLAAVFAPSAHELGHSFSAVFGVTATLNGLQAEQNRIALFLVRGVVTEAHLLDPGRAPRPLKSAKDHLTDLFGEKNVIAFGDGKTEYVQTLFGWFEGLPHLSEREAFAAARAIGKACAFRPVDSVHETIRSEILDEVDMTSVVETTSGITRHIRALKEQAKRLKAAIGALTGVESHVARARGHFQDARRFDYAYAFARLRSNQRDIANATARIAHKQAEIVRLEKLNEAANETLAQHRAQELALNTRLLAIPAHGEAKRQREAIDRAKGDMLREGTTLTGAINRVIALYEQRRGLLQRLAPIPALQASLTAIDKATQDFQPENLAAVLATVSRVLATGEEAVDQRALIGRVAKDTEEYLASLLDGEDALYHAVPAAKFAAARERDEVGEELKQVISRAAALGSGRFDLPPAVAEALEAIRHEYPGANPTVVAEHVEPKGDTPWIGAIEGYIGPNRYTILVEPAYETPAQTLLRRLPRHNFRPRVAQVSRLLRESRSLTVEPGSILEELEIKNPVAKAYLVGNFGRVLKVHRDEDLRSVHRGITIDGLQAGGYAVQRLDLVPPEGRAFGVAARQKALEALLAKRDALTHRASILDQHVTLLGAVAEALKKLPREDLLTPFEAIVRAQERIFAAEKVLATLDLGTVQDLEAKQRALLETIGELEKTIAGRNKEIGHTGREDAERELAEAQAQTASRQTAYDTARVALLEMAHLDPDASAEVLVREAEALGESQKLESLIGSRTNTQLALANSLADVRNAIADYNRTATPSEMLHSELPTEAKLAAELDTYRRLQDVVRQVTDHLRAFRSHALANNTLDLEEAERQFNSVFTSLFAQKMCNSLFENVKVKDQINARLRGLVFGRDSYQITAEWVPQFKAYADLFRVLRDRGEELVDGKTIFDLELPEDLAAARGLLRELLLGEDANAADKRLLELVDWRNYRTYDIEIRRTDQPGVPIKLSEWATGSGGETQTPFYVVRAAVLSAALRHGNDSKTHLASLVLDEAFAAMDGERSRKAMELQKSTFGFQVIVVMPTKNAGAVKPLFDREFQFALVDAQPIGSGKRVTTCRQVDLNPASIEALFRSTYAALAAGKRAEAGLAEPAPGVAGGGDTPKAA